MGCSVATEEDDCDVKAAIMRYYIFDIIERTLILQVYIADGSVPTLVAAYKQYGNFKWQFKKRSTENLASTSLPQNTTNYGSNEKRISTQNQDQEETAT